jgi:hypothetical protein
MAALVAVRPPRGVCVNVPGYMGGKDHRRGTGIFNGSTYFGPKLWPIWTVFVEPRTRTGSCSPPFAVCVGTASSGSTHFLIFLLLGNIT